MILRIDDVSANTDLVELKTMIDLASKCETIENIIICVNILARYASKGSVYPNPPFKDQDIPFFYEVDRVLDPRRLFAIGQVEIVSHGLIHADHSILHRRAQAMSIVSSCNVLDTNVFVPPFNRYNEDTESICRINEISLVRPEEGWKSLDYEVLVKNELNKSENLYYMHPWRWNIELFKDKFTSKIN